MIRRHQRAVRDDISCCPGTRTAYHESGQPGITPAPGMPPPDTNLRQRGVTNATVTVDASPP
jgi:hypothetical protein